MVQYSLGTKARDLALAIDDELDGDRLHAPRREAAAHLRPEQRRDLVADEAVENSPRLLRVDAVHVDVMRVLERRQRRLFRDLVELDPLGIGELQELGQVPGDRLAFAIGIGREIDVGRAFDRAAQLLDDVAFALDRQVFRREVVLDVDAQRALWEGRARAPPMPSPTYRAGKKLLDRPRFRRRFHDDQGLFHGP